MMQMCMVILRDFPCNSALFGLVMTPVWVRNFMTTVIVDNPPGERSHITPSEKKNHRLKSTFGRGYVSSQEGHGLFRIVDSLQIILSYSYF